MEKNNSFDNKQKTQEKELKEKFLILIEEAKMEQLTNQKFKKINSFIKNEDELREKAKKLIMEARNKNLNSILQNNNESNINSNEKLNESLFSLNNLNLNNENIFKTYKLKKVKDLPSLRKKFGLRLHNNFDDYNENIIKDSNRLKDDSNKIESFFVNFELNDLEKEQKKIDKDASILEKKLHQMIGKNEDKLTEEYYLKKWFSLVNRRNALLRRQTQLNILENEKNLNKRYNLLNEELQALVIIEENQKTEIQKKKEKLLLQELVEIVNKRSELVMHLDNQEQGVFDDSITRTLTQQNSISCEEKNENETNCFLM